MFDKSKYGISFQSWLSGTIVILLLILLQGVSFLWLRIAGVTVIALGMFMVIQRLAFERRRLLNAATLDELTGLGNFRAYQERLLIETQRAARKEKPLTLILLDFDRFKNYNDSYGHRQGNKLLFAAGKVFKDAVRSIDGVYRFGGDEFAIVLPETNLEQALQVVKRIQASFQTLPNRSMVTLSVGMAAYRGEPLYDFFDYVDQMLYTVKANGGNGCQFEAERSKTNNNNNSKSVM